MALGEERSNAIAPAASLGGRIQSPPETFGRRLVIWTLAVAGLTATIRLGPASHIGYTEGLLALACAFGGGAGLGAGLFYFAAFFTRRQVRDLLQSAALVTMGSGALMQRVIDFGRLGPLPDDRLLTTASLCGAAAFCASAYTRAEWRPVTRAGGWLQIALSAAFVCSFPLAALPDAVEGFLLHSTGSAYESSGLICPITVGILLAALIGSYRRHVREGDRRASIDCYFLVPFIIAIATRYLSTTRTDAWGQCSQILYLWSWLIFLLGIAFGQAMAHREAIERLHELESQQEVAWSLVGPMSPGELLSMFAETVRYRVGATIGILYLATESGDALQAVGVSGPEDVQDRLGAAYETTGVGFRPGFHTGHTVRALKTMLVQTACDVEVDVELVPWRMLARDNGCAISLPLVHEGEAFGVVSLYFSDQTQCTPQRLKFLATITSSASPAIARAWASSADRGLGECPSFGIAA